MSLARNIGGEELGQETTMTKVGIAAFIGALVEWYDYFLYGLAASVVFTQLFFPLENRLFGTLAAFATFGVGFFFRPLGGAIFGHYGDKLGRKAILVLTLLLMGLATFLIGILPTFIHRDPCPYIARRIAPCRESPSGVSGAAPLCWSWSTPPEGGVVFMAAGPRWGRRPGY